MFNQEDKEKKGNVIYVFIDASNVWNVVKSKRKFIEYSHLKNYFKEKFDANEVEVFYYDAYPKKGTRDYDLDGKHKFYTYLKKGLGFVVRKKELKRYYRNSNFLIALICLQILLLLLKQRFIARQKRS
jgi:hypothetical protein